MASWPLSVKNASALPQCCSLHLTSRDACGPRYQAGHTPWGSGPATAPRLPKYPEEDERVMRMLMAWRPLSQYDSKRWLVGMPARVQVWLESIQALGLLYIPISIQAQGIWPCCTPMTLCTGALARPTHLLGTS